MAKTKERDESATIQLRILREKPLIYLNANELRFILQDFNGWDDFTAKEVQDLYNKVHDRQRHFKELMLS